MYIGNINNKATVSCHHANTKAAFEPEIINGRRVWSAKRLFDSKVDLTYTFDSEYYIGTVELCDLENAGEICLIADGAKIRVSQPAKPILVNLPARELTVRIEGNVDNLSLGEVNIFGFLVDDDEPFLLPRPKKLIAGDNLVRIGSVEGEGEDAAFTKSFLIDSLSERLADLPSGEGIALSFEIDHTYENERYTVSVTNDAATVKAASRLALLWGACRVIDLWNEGCLPVIEIDDIPDLPMRGFHMGLPRRDQIDFVKKLARYVLLPLGYNHVILEFNGDMRYDSHPEITEAWLESERLHREGKGERVMHADIGADGTALEKAEVRELVDTFDSYGIEVIPELQSLSHIEYITNAHPEFAELGKCIDTLDKETLDKLCHPNIKDHCYCPSDEGCMRLVLDLIDEVVEVVRPKRYVHIGHDEVYHIGLCPECKKKGAPRVYAEHVMALYDHLKKKGLGTMLWSDMFHTDMYYTGEDFASVKAALPKDLLLLDFTWYFHPEKDIEDFILPEGYKVMMGNFYSSHYTRFSSRIKKDGMIGAEVSTWTAVNEEKFANNGKFFELPYAAEMLWNAYSYDERNRPSFTALIGQLVIPEMRDLMHGRYDLFSATDIDTAKIIGCFDGDGKSVPEELLHLELCEPIGRIKVSGRYDRLIFAHTTKNPAPRICWQDLIPVGKYTVTYKDGEEIDVPVNYAGGILTHNAFFGIPKPQIYYRHQGYVGTWYSDPVYEGRTPEGSPVLLLGQFWDNPHPDKKISHITYTPDENDHALLLSAGILGVTLDGK